MCIWDECCLGDKKSMAREVLEVYLLVHVPEKNTGVIDDAESRGESCGGDEDVSKECYELVCVCVIVVTPEKRDDVKCCQLLSCGSRITPA